MRHLITLFILSLACLGSPGHSQLISADNGQSEKHVFTGTIEEIDTGLLKMTVKTDIGREESFNLKGPELLAGLTQGDRVSVELNDKHVATKIIKTPLPELPRPPAGRR